MKWRRPLLSVVIVGLVGMCMVARAESPGSEEKGRFSSRAQRFLEEAKVRLETDRKVQAEQALIRQRENAQRLAIRMSQEKLKQQTAQARETQRQVKQARERQLKMLYQKALALSQQGSFDGVADVVQKMAVLEPNHPLVRSADRLMARAEMKRFEQRLRSSTKLPPQAGGATVSGLEHLLAQKRMELETVLKYARAEAEAGRYEEAEKLLTAVLVQDPSQHQAKALLESVKLARLNEEYGRVARSVEGDEQAMVNEILKAQLLPQTHQVPVASPVLTQAESNGVSAKLRQPVSFEFDDVPLSDVIEFIADAANVSIVPSPQLDLKSRRVSLKVSQLPLEQAIKYLVKSLALAYRIEQDAVVIATSEEFSNEPLETRVFFLRNGFGPFALTTSAVERNPVLAMESIQTLIEHSVPQAPGSKLVIDERTGALIATNTGENLILLERLLGQLDVVPTQVLIEARFVELTMTNLAHLGLESVLNGNVTLDRKEASDGTEGAGNQITSGGGLKFPALARESEGLNLTLQGVLTGSQFETVLHLLEESKKSKTLSAPRVTTLNNQTATMRVVEEFNYPTRYEVSLIQFDINGDGDFDDAGETEFANVPKDFQKRDVGILLNVTPSVGKDLSTITLVLAPEVSQFSQFRNLGAGVTVPEFTSSQLTTSVVITNGETAMLGGLMTDATSTSTTKVPFLGDLPLFGGLFRQTEDTSSRKNLLIFITARLLAPRAETI